jgi:flagellar hook-length control protein FliK
VSLEARGALPPLPRMAERGTLSRPRGSAQGDPGADPLLAAFVIPLPNSVPAPRPVEGRDEGAEGQPLGIREAPTLPLPNINAWPQGEVVHEGELAGGGPVPKAAALSFSASGLSADSSNPALLSQESGAVREDEPSREQVASGEQALKEEQAPVLEQVPSKEKAPTGEPFPSREASLLATQNGAKESATTRPPEPNPLRAEKDSRLTAMSGEAAQRMQGALSHKGQGGGLSLRDVTPVPAPPQAAHGEAPRRELARLRGRGLSAAAGSSPAPAPEADASRPQALKDLDAAQRAVSRWREDRVKAGRGQEDRTSASQVKNSASRRDTAVSPAPASLQPMTTVDLLALRGSAPISRPRATASTARAARVAELGRLLEQVRGRVERLQLEGGGRVELRLDPAELGSLDLRLEKEGGAWRLEIVAGRAETAQELLRQAKDLQEHLARAGLRLEELRLSEAQAPRNQGALPQREGQPGAEERGRNAQGGQADPRPEAELPDGDADPAQRRQEDFASRLGKLIRTEREKGSGA